MTTYEEERAARIARNKAMLMSLGIEKKIVVPQKRVYKAKSPPREIRRSSRVEKAEREKAKADLDSEYARLLHEKSKMRGSWRHYNRYDQDIAEIQRKIQNFDTYFEELKKNVNKPKTESKVETKVGSKKSKKAATYSSDSSDEAEEYSGDSTSEDEVTYVPNKRQKRPVDDLLANIPVLQLQLKPQGPKTSTKEINLTVPSKEHVGHLLSPRGKQAVMYWLCPRYTPSFSLMEGCQRLKNAIVLFMNIDIDDRYINIFTQDSKSHAISVSWFARKSLYPEHPLIHQLIHGKQADQSSIESTHSLPILLFFRFHPESPYIYGGELAYIMHKDSRPVELQFELLDADKMTDDLIKLLLRSD
ncbi:hypothetical protein THRCLA_09281 [Thraustotheca clavata]|uniref:Uncharacterized protein n=1 Tax=Thraustotheca clavata TaxID=74557 RepID=A0A1V9YXT0_9STRA|nr:hypothetical protein THRCLA_09281 [Thraustotheca clavata]